MNNTGRIKLPPTPTARRLLFEQTASACIQFELPHIITVDKAHLVMLAECGIIEVTHARRLLCSIINLHENAFAPLFGRVPYRGVYLMYEDWLIETLGIQTGGILQIARSRNDLGATVLKLRMRQIYLDLMREALRLQAVLLARARRFADVAMPAYTHGQAAMPSTYGHYLAALAQALSRDLNGFQHAVEDIHSCPLGAGAVAGTSLPIDPSRTARLLGFRTPVLNSIDAVASRDLVLRILAACAIYSVTLSRLAADLFQWSTAEFDFIHLSDQLCGSSSAMPQKRNPFLLEHVLGRAASSSAAFMQSAMAMHAMPFTNSIAVGTEAVSTLWDAMQKVRESTSLTRLVVSGARPNREAMLHRAEYGYISATELANRFVLHAGFDFRTAHRTVGEIVLAALAKNHQSLEDAAREYLSEHHIQLDLSFLDPAALVAGTGAGGGPAPEAFHRCFQAAHDSWKSGVHKLNQLTRWWMSCNAELQCAIDSLSRRENVCAHLASYKSKHKDICQGIS